MLLRRLSWPANDVPLACGVSRVIDSSRPEMVGSVAMSSRPTDVGGAGSRRREDGIAHARHFDLFGNGNRLDADVDVAGHAEVDVDVLDGLRRERGAASADVDNLNRVRAADAHRRYRVAPVCARRRFVARARRLVYRNDAGPRDRLLLRGRDDATDAAGRDALRGQARRATLRRRTREPRT